MNMISSGRRENGKINEKNGKMGKMGKKQLTAVFRGQDPTANDDYGCRGLTSRTATHARLQRVAAEVSSRWLLASRTSSPAKTHTHRQADVRGPLASGSLIEL